MTKRTEQSLVNRILDLGYVAEGEVFTFSNIRRSLPDATKEQVSSALQSLRDSDNLHMIRAGVYRKPTKSVVHTQRLAQPVYDPRRDHLIE